MFEVRVACVWNSTIVCIGDLARAKFCRVCLSILLSNSTCGVYKWSDMVGGFALPSRRRTDHRALRKPYGALRKPSGYIELEACTSFAQTSFYRRYVKVMVEIKMASMGQA